MLFLKGIWMALTLFTITPCPQCWEERSLPWVIASFPLIGLVVGGVWWAGAWAMEGLPLALRAVGAAALPWVISGFMHLDGFMDVSDALLSRRDQSEMLRILKDPHTGAFAVLAAGLLMLMQTAGAWSLMETSGRLWPLLLMPVWSRTMAASLVQWGTPMAQSSYAKMLHEGAGRMQRGMVVLIGIACCLLMHQIWLVWLVMGLVYGLTAWSAVRKLGGINGDVAGFALVLSELAGLIILSILPGTL